VPSVIALAVKRLTGAKFLFDMRGFWADERVDGGIWPRTSRLFRLAKDCERIFLQSADHVVSLTHRAVGEIKTFDYLRGRFPAVTVIPTCADLSKFRSLSYRRSGEPFVLGYVGSAGTWYLFDEVAACFSFLLTIKPHARLLILNRGEHAYIRERLFAMRIPDESVEIREAAHSDVPRFMAGMDAGIFFYKPSYSRLACAPTKLAEFLGCGVPCLSNEGVGDMPHVLETEGVGVVLHSFDHTSRATAVKALLSIVNQPGVAERCVAASQRHFSLDAGVAKYATIYEGLLSLRLGR
jgi:glycosyltransferase involved in cell wall biosynthesis